MDEVYLKQTALTAFPVSPKALRFSESQVDTNKRNAVGTMICCCAPPLQAGKKKKQKLGEKKTVSTVENDITMNELRKEYFESKH